MGRLNADFWKFWTGQTVSNLGSSFSQFALPLLVYKLTGSALNLGITTAVEMLPYLFFGLLIGAWVDRVDRKRLMIWTDIVRALLTALIPFLAVLHLLTMWWIYGLGFVLSTATIFFTSGEFAAIPSLVESGDLVTANGRIQASYSAATVVGPLLAGVLVAVMPLPMVLLFDAASFLLSAVSLLLIRRSFNVAEERASGSIRQDIVDGLRYVIGHPVLRNISMMMALVNFVGSTAGAQLVFFAKRQFWASDPQVAVLYSAGSIGIVVLALAAGPLRKRWPFSKVALSALMLSGASTVALALTHSYPVGVVLWAVTAGLGILFNINTGSLRQAIVPNHMLGRVISIAGVLAWSAIPLGTLLGGILIQRSGNVALVYAAIGVLTILIPAVFSLTALGRAERYLPEKTSEPAAEPASA